MELSFSVEIYLLDEENEECFFAHEESFIVHEESCIVDEESFIFHEDATSNSSIFNLNVCTKQVKAVDTIENSSTNRIIEGKFKFLKIYL
jgi:hypothetical protein